MVTMIMSSWLSQSFTGLVEDLNQGRHLNQEL